MRAIVASLALAATFAQGTLPPGAWRAAAVSADASLVVAGIDNTAVQSVGPLYISRDGGRSFQAIANLTGNWRSAAMSHDGTVIAAAPAFDFIHVSWDSGNTWKPVAQSQEWYSVSVSWNGKSMVASGWAAPIVTSTTAGATWASRVPYAFGVATAMVPDASLMIALNHSATPANALASTDHGLSFAPTYAAPRLRGVAVSANGSVVAIARNGGYYSVISRDGGHTFSQLTSGVDTFAVAVSADATAIMVGNVAGPLQYSVDSGTTWVTALNGMTAQWCNVVMSPAGSLWLAVDCTPNTGNVWFSRNQGVTWCQGGC